MENISSIHDDILDRIINKGCFIYHPSFWCTDYDLALEELIKLNLIQREVDKYPETWNQNGGYVYTKKEI